MPSTVVLTCTVCMDVHEVGSVDGSLGGCS